MSDAMSPLNQFRTEVMINVGLGMIDLDVVDTAGRHPVVVALESESIAVLMRRVSQIGNFANVFVGGGEQIRLVNVLPAESAIFEHEADDMTSEPPRGNVTVGTFLDYLETQQHGVRVPALLPSSEVSTIARPREVSFAL